MSEDIRTRLRIDVEQGKATVREVADDFERIEPAAKKAGKAGEKAGKEMAMGLKEAQAESRRLEKTILQQEKLTQEWRKELIRVESAQKNVGKNKKEYFQLQSAAKRLNGAIKENVADIKGLRLDKRQVDGNIKDLKAQEKAFDKNTKSANGFFSRIEKGLNLVGIDISGVTNKFNEVNDVIGVSANESKGFASAQNAATSATSKTSKSLRVLRVALISTGIGAIVVAVGSLVAAFLSTQRGADALNRALAPLKATMQVLLGVLQDIATDIVDAFENPQQALKDLGQLILDNIINRFTAIPRFAIAAFETTIAGFEFLGAKIRQIVADIPALNNLFEIDTDKATKDAADALARVTNGLGDLASSQIQFSFGLDESQQKAFVDTIEGAFETGIEAGGRLKNISIELEELAIRRAKAEGALRNEYQKQREIASDVGATAKERADAADRAIAAQRKLFAFDEQRLNLEIEAQRIKNSLNDTSRADELALQELIAERTGLEADLGQRVLDIIRNKNTAQKQAAEQEKKRIADAAKLEEDRLKREQEINEIIAAKRLELTQVDANAYDIRRQQAEAYYAELLEREGVTAEQRAEIERLLSDELLAIKFDEKEERLRLEQELIDGIENLQLSSIEREIQAAESKYTRLFELARGNAEATKTLEEQLANDILKIQRRAEQEKIRIAAVTVQTTLQSLSTLTSAFAAASGEQAKDNQELALFQIGLNTATGIASAVAQGAAAGPPPANIIAIAAGIAAVLSGIAQARAALSERPSFYDGTEYVQRGNNPKGRDTIPAYLNEGEGVVTTEKNRKYKGLVRAINADQVREWAASHFFDSRLANMKVVHSVHNTSNNTSDWNDRRLHKELQKSNDIQSLMLAELSRARGYKVKRAG